MVHGKKVAKVKVFWTEEEMRAVAAEMVRLCLEDREIARIFISQAQSVLPPERRRKVIGRNSTSNRLVELFCLARGNALEPQDPLVINLEKEVVVERPREEILNGITTEELVGLVVRRISPLVTAIGAIPDLIKSQRERQIQGEVAPVTRTKAEPVAVSALPKVKVIMCGFLPGQETDIRSKAAGFNLDLVFYRKDARQGVPPAGQWCVMMRKVSHAFYDRVQQSMESRVRIVEGISGALKELADINALVGTGVR